MHSMEQEAASSAALVVALSRSDASYIQNHLLLPEAPCSTVQVHGTWYIYHIYHVYTTCTGYSTYTTGRCAFVLQLKADIPSVLPTYVSCEIATFAMSAWAYLHAGEIQEGIDSACSMYVASANTA